MMTLTRSLSRVAIATGLVLAAASAFVTTSADPAMAICKYGTPHCINKHPGPQPPTVGGVSMPGSGWVDPECEYYPGLCGSSEVKGTELRRPPTKFGNRFPVVNRLPVANRLPVDNRFPVLNRLVKR